jgi:putative sigma-54 modulation protein
LKNAIEEKLGRIRVLENQNAQFHVLLEKEKLHFIADIGFVLDGKRFYFQTKEPTVAEAIDSLMDKLERHVRKHKERVHTHTHDRAAVKRETAPILFEYIEVNRGLRSELDVALQLADSDREAEVFFSEDTPDSRTAMAALKESDEHFAIYGSVPGEGRWYCKQLYLTDDEIDHTRIEDCYPESMDDREALAKMENEPHALLLYTNAETHKVQAMLREQHAMHIYILETE